MAKGAELSENSKLIAQKRYYMNGEDWKSCCERVARTISSCEIRERDKYETEFFNMIYNQEFLPGGRIFRNCARPRGSLFNCYHLPIGDSIDEIGQCLKDSLILWSEGGGVGINFSPLRPKGDSILGKGGNSSGLVSFLEAFDSAANTIESGGARRAAAIAHVDISHPEVINFIDAKLVDQKLRHFNISVSINDDFLEAVESNQPWTFRFKQKEYGTVQARDLWNHIVENMVTCAEPGLINWSKFSKNNSYYFSPVMGTNPCGETTLGPYEACDLGSIVVPNFIPPDGKNTNWKKLDQVVRLAVRFLDNVIEVNKYVLKDIDINVHKSRRVGIGILGLAEYLFAKEARYGSDKAVRETENLLKFIRDSAYRASVELAVEKGSFPQFDAVAYGKASFIRKLHPNLRQDIKKYGVRNCTLMALAPTGTISLLTPHTSAIEPLFAKAYMRNDRLNERVYIHPKYEEMIRNNQEIPEWFVDSYDLEPKHHFEIQAACQKFCDGSVSKTINMPAGSTKEDLSALLLEYMYDLKGVTVYVDNSREGQILNRIPEDKIRELLSEKNVKDTLTEDDVQCISGTCEV